jgi:hypothetical protein
MYSYIVLLLLELKNNLLHHNLFAHYLSCRPTITNLRKRYYLPFVDDAALGDVTWLLNRAVVVYIRWVQLSRNLRRVYVHSKLCLLHGQWLYCSIFYLVPILSYCFVVRPCIIYHMPWSSWVNIVIVTFFHFQNKSYTTERSHIAKWRQLQLQCESSSSTVLFCLSSPEIDESRLHTKCSTQSHLLQPCCLCCSHSLIQ